MCAIGFTLEDGQDHGVTFNKYFGCSIAAHNPFHWLIEVKAKQRRRIQSASQQILSDSSRSAHVRLHDYVIHHVVLSWASLRWHQKLVKLIVEAREFPYIFAANQLDPFHRRCQPVVIAHST